MTELRDPRDSETDPHVRASVRAALFGDEPPARPTIGRFRVTGELGRGGMGQVLAAFDDELERKVAIKLLHHDIGAEHGARLKREAKALAKLSHPNVVHVYEVGTHEGRLFIAMELVPGTTLRAWLAETTRSVDEVLDMFVAAGRGLAAAHGGGLVHRDFKPDNVLVGEDGRPRILDFGLARSDDGEGGPRLDAPDLDALGDQISGTEDTQLEGSLTATGAILGTPAYMSPEQFRGEHTTLATDQFSFCVALWEAIYGRRPFLGKGLKELAHAVLNEPPAAPEPMRGPAGLRRILERGLAKPVEDRWPDFDTLLAEIDELRAAPLRRRRAMILGGALALAAGAVSWALLRPPVEESTPAATPPAEATSAEASLCLPVADRLAGVWDAQTRSAIAQRYTESDSLRARQWWRFEGPLLDDWVAQWSRIYEASCAEADRENMAQFALVQACLDQRMIEIRTRVELNEELDPEERAALGSNNYLPFYLPRECEQQDILRAATLYPSDPEARQAVLDAMLAFRVAEGRAAGALYAGTPERFAETREAFMRAKKTVEATGFVPAIAEVRLREGNAWLFAGGRPDLGMPMLDEAVRLAEEARADAIGVFARLRQVYWHMGQGTEAIGSDELDRDFAEWDKTLQRAGSPAHAVLQLLGKRAAHRLARGDREGMLADVDRALEVAAAAYGPTSFFMSHAYGAAADTLWRAGDTARAAEARQQSIAVIEATFGEESANLGLILAREREAALVEGRLDDAEAVTRRQLRLATLHDDSGQQLILEAKIHLARVLMARGRYADAAQLIDDVAPEAATLEGSQTDPWANLVLTHMALVGEPSDAAREATTPETVYPGARQLSAALAGVMRGDPPGKAEADLATKLEDPEWFQNARAAARIQQGRLLEQLGRRKEAVAAFQAVLDAEREPPLPGVPQYGPVLETAARHHLRRLGHDPGAGADTRGSGSSGSDLRPH